MFTGLWDEAARLFPELKAEIPAAINRAVLQEAQELRKTMVGQFRAQAPVGGSWAPLSPMTLRSRKAQGFGGTKILIRSADLRNSIAVVPVSPGVAFVGVHRTTRSSKSGGVMSALVNLGELHEFGKVIQVRVTRKMQRYLFGVVLRTKNGRDNRGKFVKKGAGRGGSGKFRVGATLTIRIPARPFVGPAVGAKSQAEYEASIAARFATNMKGKIGKP